jgi:hypothetical protein
MGLRAEPVEAALGEGDDSERRRQHDGDRKDHLRYQTEIFETLAHYS